jgi:hypothetical protein
VDRSDRGLRAVLTAIGGVATVAGARAVVQGAAEAPGGGRFSAEVDSEYRFYGAWYHVFGLLMLRAARRPHGDATMVRACAFGFLVAASGRALSMRSRGRPHPSQVALMAVELAVPAVLLPWHARAQRSR